MNKYQVFFMGFSELGIGTNQGTTRFTKNIFFDEKMAETIHLAIGNAYKECGELTKAPSTGT